MELEAFSTKEKVDNLVS